MTDLLPPDDAGDDLLAFEDAPLRLSVDLAALAGNWRQMAALSGRARTGAVIKADAYGLGVEDCGAALYFAGARDFFVATAEEGAALRPYAPEARIFVLSGLWPGLEPLIFGHDLVPVIASEEQLAFFMRALADHGDHPCALQVDTGFHRLGLSVAEALDLANDATRPASFDPVLVISHLACGDDAAAPMNRAQVESFRQVAAAFEGVESSLSASAGIRLGPDYHFDLTRPGIALYGAAASAGGPRLETVATAEARILQVRQARAGETVSYGAGHVLTRDSLIAVAAVGYADGYPRSLSGRGEGLIHGRRVPILGRITMDMTMFDVTDLGGRVRAGDYVELFGPGLAVDDVAAAAGTIPYEILAGLGLRYRRETVIGDEA